MLYVELESLLVRTPPNPHGPSGFDALLAIAERGAPFTAVGGRAFISVPAPSGGHLTFPIRSRAFRQWVFDQCFTPRDPPLHPQSRRPKFPRLAPLPRLAPRRPPHTRPLSHPHPPWSFRLRQIPRRPHPQHPHRSFRFSFHPFSVLRRPAPHPRPPQLGPRLRPRLHPHPQNRRHLLPPHQRRRCRLP